MIGGAQVGYNWQASPSWVFGAEADIQASDMKRDKNCILPCNAGISIAPGIPALFPVVFSENSAGSKIEWFGTLRGRVGYAAGSSLFYVTGGLAYGEVERHARVKGNTTFLGVVPVNAFEGAYSSSSTKTGWVLGGGVESKLNNRWSAKAEYLYMDLGSVTDTFNTVVTAGAGAGLVAGNRTITTDLREHIFRVGLNYSFGGATP